MESDSSTQNQESALAEQADKLYNKEVPEEMLALDTQPTTETARVSMDENLFGRFFCDRAEFHIIKKPKNQVYTADTESITLYYLDNELRQTKYDLASDISTFLMRDLGSFKIIGFDVKNREIINNEKIVLKTQSGVTLNNRLDNFELRWVFDNKEINYRVSVNSKTKFMYVEKAKGFEKEFKEIERHCI